MQRDDRVGSLDLAAAAEYLCRTQTRTTQAHQPFALRVTRDTKLHDRAGADRVAAKLTPRELKRLGATYSLVRWYLAWWWEACSDFSALKGWWLCEQRILGALRRRKKLAKSVKSSFLVLQHSNYNKGMSTSSERPPVDLTDHFLIAMPAMQDTHFARTLTYVCEHNKDGAMGVIVNRPIDLSLESLFEKIDLSLNAPGFGELPVYFGGPVQTDRGFVLHRPAGEWQSSLRVRDDMGLTSSRDVLQSVGREGTPTEILVALGYAGWSAGQLEDELSKNAWLTVAADPRIIFDLPPEERLEAAMALLGVDFANLSEVAGHA